MNVAIVGGGIAGLTVAWRLQQQGIPYQLIEADTILGGKIKTDSVDGFIIEGGPDSFLAEKPWARELCEELDLGGEIIGTNDAARQTFLVSRGKLRPLPDGFVMLAPVKPLPLLRSRLVSIPGVMRMVMEPFIPVRRDEGDESIGAFVRRRFGDEVLERIVDPLMSGIYAGHSDELSLASTFPRLRELEQKHKSVIRGILSMPARAKSSSSMFLSLRGGMGRLVDALASRLDRNSVIRGTRVQEVRRDANYRLRLSDGRSLTADCIVVATPSFVTARVVEKVDGTLASMLDEIPYVSTATISLAYRRSDVAHPLNGFGFVVPRVERRRITACTWVSTKLSHRAPEDSALLRCFIGRAGEEQWIGMSDDELIAIARSELAGQMGVDAAPQFARVYRWERSMPQYRVGHQQLLERIDACAAQHEGLFLTGSAYRGVGLPDVIRQANETARRVATFVFDRSAARFAG